MTKLGEDELLTAFADPAIWLAAPFLDRMRKPVETVREKVAKLKPNCTTCAANSLRRAKAAMLGAFAALVQAHRSEGGDTGLLKGGLQAALGKPGESFLLEFKLGSKAETLEI